MRQVTSLADKLPVAHKHLQQLKVLDSVLPCSEYDRCEVRRRCCMIPCMVAKVRMRSNVTFRCSLPIDLDKHPPGEELAEWIASRMTDGGLVTRVIDNYEDFAWWIESESDQRMPWALLGYINDGPAEWLLQINSSVGWLGRLLGRSDKAGRRLFSKRLQVILTTEPAFSDVRWHVGEWSDQGWACSPDTTEDGMDT